MKIWQSWTRFLLSHIHPLFYRQQPMHAMAPPPWSIRMTVSLVVILVEPLVVMRMTSRINELDREMNLWELLNQFWSVWDVSKFIDECVNRVWISRQALVYVFLSAKRQRMTLTRGIFSRVRSALWYMITSTTLQVSVHLRDPGSNDMTVPSYI